MNQPIAATWKPQITSTAVPGCRLGNKIRFVVGLAINLAGAGVLLADISRFIL